MGAFTPFKRNANKFKYVPRYYDPAKEARDLRRAELHGRRDDEREPNAELSDSYRPGQYIRTSRDARSQRRSESKAGSRQKMWISIVVLLVVAYMCSMLYGKIMQLLDLTESTQQGVVTEEVEEFNPYAPITIVPNDYVEE